ncbi:MAG: NYN domain-containing protein [Burkholderiales bacterium]
MSRHSDTHNMAVFCDFENIAIGVREAKYAQFDISKVLERLLLKGSIVVKKAYCDWERYKEFKTAMHYAAFELIEVPHVRQSGKNSADIRMVVDALDLCYTKAHVDTFVIVSGDSDFSPLVSKLRENDKSVVGIGVKMSTSELLIAGCDEFIYYDDLVREAQAQVPAKKRTRGQTPTEEKSPKDGADDRKRDEAFDLVVQTVRALQSERGEDEKLWGSMIKQALKRRRPGFNEGYYGFRSFNRLLEEAEAGKLLTLERDEKSGGYIVTPASPEGPRPIRTTKSRSGEAKT